MKIAGIIILIVGTLLFGVGLWPFGIPAMCIGIFLTAYKGKGEKEK